MGFGLQEPEVCSKEAGSGGGACKTWSEERRVWPDPRHPLELEAVLKFMEAFCAEEHSHGNTNLHDSEYSKDDRTAQERKKKRHSVSSHRKRPNRLAVNRGKGYLLKICYFICERVHAHICRVHTETLDDGTWIPPQNGSDRLL